MCVCGDENRHLANLCVHKSRKEIISLNEPINMELNSADKDNKDNMITNLDLIKAHWGSVVVLSLLTIDNLRKRHLLIIDYVQE